MYMKMEIWRLINRWSVPVSIRIEDSGNWNLFIKRYFIHLASLIQPLSSCLEYRYDMPQIKAFLRPWAEGGGPGGAWLYGDRAGSCGCGGGAWSARGGGGTARGSAICVTPWHIAHLIDLAPAGSCNGVRQWAQFTNIIVGGGGITGGEGQNWKF